MEEMKIQCERLTSFVWVLTAASTLLASLLPSIASCGCNSVSACPASASLVTDLPLGDRARPQSCCDSMASENVSCCCCPAPQAPAKERSKPGPQRSCTSCQCDSPSDAVPPVVAVNGIEIAVSIVDLPISLDFPGMTAKPDRYSTTHHPPALTDLVISLSRLTC